GAGTAIALGTSDYNLIENCIITNYARGIYMTDTMSHGNTIGGTTVAARNVISGNSVGIYSEYDSYANTIQGNFIGTNAAGDAPLGNGTGIYIQSDFSGNTIGGSTVVPGAPPGNVISGNGVGIVTVTGMNLIHGNLIG